MTKQTIKYISTRRAVKSLKRKSCRRVVRTLGGIILVVGFGGEGCVVLKGKISPESKQGRAPTSLFNRGGFGKRLSRTELSGLYGAAVVNCS